MHNVEFEEDLEVKGRGGGVTPSPIDLSKTVFWFFLPEMLFWDSGRTNSGI